MKKKGMGRIWNIGLTLLFIAILLGGLARPASSALFTEYTLAGDYRPRGITADEDGRIWFTEQFGNKIGRREGNQIKEWNIPTPASEPWDLVVEYDQFNRWNVWFTESHSGKIGRLSNDRLFLEFQLQHPGAVAPPDPTSGGFPTGIDYVKNQTDNNNIIWFTEFTGNSIGRIYYSHSGIGPHWSLDEYALPNPNSQPYDIAADPLTGLVWFTEQTSPPRVGYYNPWTSTVKEYTLNLAAGPAIPYNIDIDSDGFIWFTLDYTNPLAYDKIAKLNPWNSKLTLYDIKTLVANPRGIAIDEENQVWFTEHGSSQIGVLNPVTEYVVEYQTPTPNAQPVGITLSDDRSTPTWFTEWSANRIGRIDPDTGIEYETVTTITSATTSISTTQPTTTATITSQASSVGYSTTNTLIPQASTVTYWTATSTHTTVHYATSTITTNTETVFVQPTSTTVTTTIPIISTSTTLTTTSATLISYVSTTSTTTTNTISTVFETPISTASTAVTRQDVFTDIISTTTLTEYAATSFKFTTTTAQFFTSYSTSKIFTTVTNFQTTTITLTTTLFSGVANSLLTILAIISGILMFITLLRRRKSFFRGGRC